MAGAVGCMRRCSSGGVCGLSAAAGQGGACGGMCGFAGVRGGCRSVRLPMAAATGAVEITLPVAIVAAAYIIGQAMVDASGD